MQVNGIILAGGRSSRMGRNKALLPLMGQIMVERIRQAMLPVVKEVILVSNEPECYPDWQGPLVSDIIPRRGPLSGIHAGLSVSDCHHNLVVACDMPFVSTEYLQKLRDEAGNFDVVVPQHGDYLQPLFAVYSRNCIQPIENCLYQDIRKIIAFYPLVRVKFLPVYRLGDPSEMEQVFFNVNTPADWRLARQLAGETEEEQHE